MHVTLVFGVFLNLIVYVSESYPLPKQKTKRSENLKWKKTIISSITGFHPQQLLQIMWYSSINHDINFTWKLWKNQNLFIKFYCQKQFWGGADFRNLSLMEFLLFQGTMIVSKYGFCQSSSNYLGEYHH